MFPMLAPYGLRMYASIGRQCSLVLKMRQSWSSRGLLQGAGLIGAAGECEGGCTPNDLPQVVKWLARQMFSRSKPSEERESILYLHVVMSFRQTRRSASY